MAYDIYKSWDFDGTTGVKIPSGMEFDSLSFVGARDFVLPENLKVRYLNLKGTKGAKIPKGLICETLILQDAENAEIPEGIQVTDYFDVKRSFGMRIPANLKCREIRGDGARDLTIGENVQVEYLELGAAEDVKLHPSVQAKRIAAYWGDKDAEEELIKSMKQAGFEAAKEKIQEKMAQHQPSMQFGRDITD